MVRAVMSFFFIIIEGRFSPILAQLRCTNYQRAYSVDSTNKNVAHGKYGNSFHMFLQILTFLDFFGLHWFPEFAKPDLSLVLA
jgi:hypothetical protein